MKGKVYWIRVKELKAWTPEFNNEFYDSSSSDEDSMEDDETDHVLESSCMKQPIESKIQCNVSKQGTISADPFGIYDILNRNVGNKMHKAFPLPGESSHWQYKFPLPVEGVPTARRMEILLPRVCTAMMKKLPVKDRWQLH
nr:RNA-directed DNA polymerase, eukaryota, nucleotide-binding alpha-beta plait domain protein [Tanacetum cinerariifolium]